MEQQLEQRFLWSKGNRDGNAGGAGNSGGSGSAMGTLYVLGSVTVNAYAGTSYPLRAVRAALAAVLWRGII
jgi:hypothetical protein